MTTKDLFCKDVWKLKAWRWSLFDQTLRRLMDNNWIQLRTTEVPVYHATGNSFVTTQSPARPLIARSNAWIAWELGTSAWTGFLCHAEVLARTGFHAACQALLVMAFTPQFMRGSTKATGTPVSGQDTPREIYKNRCWIADLLPGASVAIETILAIFTVGIKTLGQAWSSFEHQHCATENMQAYRTQTMPCIDGNSSFFKRPGCILVGGLKFVGFCTSTWDASPQ